MILVCPQTLLREFSGHYFPANFKINLAAESARGNNNANMTDYESDNEMVLTSQAIGYLYEPVHTEEEL